MRQYQMIHVIGIPKKRGREEIFEEIMASNFPKLMMDTKLQI